MLSRIAKTSQARTPASALTRPALRPILQPRIVVVALKRRIGKAQRHRVHGARGLAHPRVPADVLFAHVTRPGAVKYAV